MDTGFRQIEPQAVFSIGNNIRINNRWIIKPAVMLRYGRFSAENYWELPVYCLQLQMGYTF
jgi:hypothetical protein